MQTSKYFYQGLPLSKYCKQHGINANTIRTRIWKKKQDPIYRLYTDDQIIDMVIKAYGTSTKYFYKGKTLNQYCQEHGINSATINSRITRLKEERPDLTDSELVKEVMENYNNKNFIYFYDGMPLVEYCKLHPELNYRTMKTFIQRTKKQNPALSYEEIIEMYIAKEHKGIYRYYYIGIPLKIYCEENNINYRNIISRIIRKQSKPENQNLTDDEIVELVMDNYEPFEPKYLYNGTTLMKYCQENNLSYYSIVSYVKRKKQLNPSLSIDELIDEGVKTINRYGIIYYYRGIPLIDYARQNNLKYHSIKATILRRLVNSTKSFQEVIDECVETYQAFEIKYFYNDETLFSFCQRTGLIYNTIIHRYLTDYKDSTISVDEAVKIIVDNYLENPPIATKYYFENQSLRSFCVQSGYSYSAIYQRIRHLEQKGNLENLDDIIEKSIEEYEKKIHINKINEIFKAIKNNQTTSEEELIDICAFLEIDYPNLQSLLEMNFTLNQSLNLIWYFGEPTSLNKNKVLTDKRLKEVFSLVTQIKNANPKEIDKFSLYDLIAIYKSDLYDTRNEILYLQRRYLNHLIYSLCDAYNIKVTRSNYSEFKSELTLYLIKIINHTCLNNLGQIIKYMDITIKGTFKIYLKEYLKSYHVVSLDTPRYQSDKGTSTSKTKLDYIASEPSTSEESSYFSKDMMSALSTLDKEDLDLIILKYQEDYSYSELATVYKTTEEEIKEREIRIITSLKDNDNIKRLQKKI